ncbi:MAG: response regulator [Ardenticatenia bacterium]|nr:MAG: response regulator [Ardenticatenia bacterium]
MKRNNGELSRILVVEDTDDLRALMRMRLERRGHEVLEARNGAEALRLLATEPVDLVLLDIMMPEVNGFEVLETIKNDVSLRHIPVVVLSALNDTDSIVKCIRMGADDYLVKPFKSVFLYARIDNLLERKRLRDREQAALRALREEQARTEQLLHSIFPRAIAERLKQGFTEGGLADQFESASVLFADIVNFTSQASRLSPQEVVQFLGEMWGHFEALTASFGADKIKTIGDAFMVAAGVPEPCDDHAERLVRLAFAMRDSAHAWRWPDGAPLHLRIGIATGPVAAGVLGTNRLQYDVWGDTVNLASRLQEHAEPDTVLVAEATWRALQSKLEGAPCEVEIKGKGRMTAYVVRGLRASTPQASIEDRQ